MKQVMEAIYNPVMRLDYSINDFASFSQYLSQHSLYKNLCNRLGQTTIENLFCAFIHKSARHELKFINTDNERLEFMGDAVISLIVSQVLLAKHTEATEGELSKMRAMLVNETTFAKLAMFFKLDGLLIVGKGEYSQKGHERPSILADAWEAMWGVLYNQYGLNFCAKKYLEMSDEFELKHGPILDHELISSFDPKSKLQEECLKRFSVLPEYRSMEIAPGKFNSSILVLGRILVEEVSDSKKKSTRALALKILNENLLDKVR